MTARQLTENTRVSVPVTALIAIITASLTAGVTFAGVRSQAINDARALVGESVAQLRREQSDALSHYVTREELLKALDDRFDRFEARLFTRLGAHR